MSKSLKNSGPRKIELYELKEELFGITKAAMVKNPKLYQFGSLDEFVNDLSVKYPSEIYVWNDESGRLVGFFAHYLVQRDIDELLIIVVDPSFQGQGYGKKMMEFYFGQLGDKMKSILSTHEKNEVAIKFYQSLGYRIVKKLPNQYGDGQTRVLMERG